MNPFIFYLHCLWAGTLRGRIVDKSPNNYITKYLFVVLLLQNACHGDGQSLVFNASSLRSNWATSRDMRLSVEPQTDEYIWRSNFDQLLPVDRWQLASASVESDCQSDRRVLILHTSNSTDVATCSPAIDLTMAGNLRFKLKPRQASCNASQHDAHSKTNSGKLSVWIEADKR